MGLGAATAGRPKSNVVGQRVFHWVNEQDKSPERWYPTDRQIDKMRENRGTMLILHQHWMRQSGSNGFPHADYRVPRDEKELRRAIARARRCGMSVAVYMRGIEDYGLQARFFETISEEESGRDLCRLARLLLPLLSRTQIPARNRARRPPFFRGRVLPAGQGVFPVSPGRLRSIVRPRWIPDRPSGGIQFWNPGQHRL